MTSNAPNTQMYNFTHMFDRPDLRGCLPSKINEGTLLEFISKNKEFSMFFNIVILSNFEDLLNSYQSDFTVFIPSNEHILEKYGRNIFEKFDIGDARNYIKSSIVDNKISSELLEKGTNLYTIDKVTRLVISKIGPYITINNSINVIRGDILCRNGIIHIIDDKIYVRNYSFS